jgi:ubiquinone/menaquinone biosynthesis C-methylase UbiE
MTDRSAGQTADTALTERHRAMWAAGDYPELVRDMLTELGPALVSASGVGAGERVLDVAAGTGNTSIPAALAGATVVASDLTPELFDAGRKAAADAGVQIEWRQADAEALPFADAEFDTVLSSIGVMFAPHHQVAADELVRVTRSGGTIGLLSWTPEGFIGQMFATMKPYAPAPPPGSQPPPLWGDEEHVRGLLGDRVTEISASRATLRVDHFRTPADFRDYFKSHYGPTIVVYRSIADDSEKVAALDRALEEHAERNDIGTDGDTVLEWEYLLLTCERV